MLPSPRFVSKHRDFKQFKQLPTPSLTIPISWSLRFLLPLFTGWREPVDVHPSSPDPGRAHQIIFLHKNTLGKDENAIPASPQASACNYHPVELELDSFIASDERHGCSQIILIFTQGHSVKVADS